MENYDFSFKGFVIYILNQPDEKPVNHRSATWSECAVGDYYRHMGEYIDQFTTYVPFLANTSIGGAILLYNFLVNPEDYNDAEGTNYCLITYKGIKDFIMDHQGAFLDVTE